MAENWSYWLSWTTTESGKILFKPNTWNLWKGIKLQVKISRKTVVKRQTTSEICKFAAFLHKSGKEQHIYLLEMADTEFRLTEYSET